MFRNSSGYSAPFVAVVFGAQLLLSACGGESVSAFEAAQATPEAAPAQQAAAPAPVAYTPPAQQTCANCGTVSAIVSVSSGGQSSGVGAAVGALVGGLVGSQVGGGNGKRIATVAGVVGGAFAGNNIEKNRNSTQEMEVVVAMDNGGEQRIRVYDTGSLGVGSRVSVDGNTINPR